jgi:RNA polymerase sigma factor (sigma-70 family)
MAPPHALRALSHVEATPAPTDRELAVIVRAASDGDAAALRCLVDRFDRALRSVTRFYRLSRWDADDVIQATWLAFLEHGRGLREPAAVSGWLMTTARRECLRMLQGRMREQPTDDPTLGDNHEDDAHHELLASERRAALLGALEELPPRRRRLMTLLVAKPDMSYEEVGQTLGMPVGSIGPTRLRSISHLRRSTRLRALREADEGRSGR